MSSSMPYSRCFFPMHNVIQTYAWGSRTSLNQLFDLPNPDQQPQAELWMGAHPNGCSLVELDQRTWRLSELIARDPAAFLSTDTANHFGELPYLFKVLAADKALSIQVHPSKTEAEAGFAKEQQAGIPLTAAERNYKDPNHKPELVYALTPYQAMNGFRSITQIIEHFSALKIAAIAPLLEALIERQTEAGLQKFFTDLLSLQGEEKEDALEDLLAHAQRKVAEPLFALIVELAHSYPNDIGLFAPLMLNVLTLQPGEAMYLDARTPHAYLKGTGLEIMANSDNVLRAGLTPKHMDIQELARCTHFVEKPAQTLRLTPHIDGQAQHYSVPVPDFKFTLYLSAQQQLITTNSAEILLPLDNEMTVSHANGDSVTLAKGQSLFIPAYVGQYTLRSQGRVARAYN